MLLIITNIKTKHIMYAWFNDIGSYKKNLLFYNTYKEKGSHKYDVNVIKNII